MSDVWAYGCVLLEIITKKFPWDKLYKTNDKVKILRACYTWSKKNPPNITKIIKDFHHTSNNDHPIRNKQNVITSYKMEMSHVEQKPSTRNRPHTSLQKNKALYDSED
ncbi:unnamed protein product [Adineta steineri]|uniref:Protein kinase domain-containing protein n=1 Tax=Adineta steineri TaxID=433720 RepID=A0A819V1E1_9BILA|nr:unnamed protein product [Adineta steineri]CAF4098646.1 unnamed protein product [Adineta steineri]